MRNNKIINRNNKKSYKEAIWQEKTKFLEIEARRQYVVGSKKYPIKMTLKEVRSKIKNTIDLLESQRKLDKEYSN